jgi:probable HAF family extracellular repeat protein
MHDLGSDLGGSYPVDVNERGDVIGWDMSADCDGTQLDRPSPTSFVLHEGKWIALGPYTEVHALNDLTQVVGSAPRPSGVSQAVLWQRGRKTPLDPGPKVSGAADVNAKGQVVGGAGSDAVLWEHGTVRKLGRPAGEKRAVAIVINDRGWVIGFGYARLSGPEWPGYTYLDYLAAPIQPRAFLWRSGTLLDLGALPGDTMSMPVALNSRGLVIGVSYSKTDEYGDLIDGRAYVWGGGTLIQLPRLPGGKFSAATAINNRNQIVGWGTTRSGNRHAVLWTLDSTR